MRISNKQMLEDLERGYFYILFRSFDGVYGIILAAFSIIITIIIGFTGTISQIKAVSMFISVIIVISTLTFFKSSLELYEIARDLKHKNSLPKVIEGLEPYNQETGAKALCILEPSELFFYNVEVSFYYRKEHHEELIGYGEVINIQDHYIQVQLNDILVGYEDVVQKIKQSNAETLNKLTVKPFVPKRNDREISR